MLNIGPVKVIRTKSGMQMPDSVRIKFNEYECKKCGQFYQCPDPRVPLSKYFCPECRKPIAEEIEKARTKAYHEYIAEGCPPWEANQRSFELSMYECRERIKRGQ